MAAFDGLTSPHTPQFRDDEEHARDTGDPDGRSGPQRMADAFVTMVRGAVDRTGEMVPMHSVTAMMCDAVIEAIVTGADGKPLRLGRRQRYFNRTQRRAKAARDGGCRAPGCDAPVGWCDAHHVRPWRLGGPTDVDNGVLLCPHHHHEVHRGVLEVVQSPGGWVVRPGAPPPGRRRGWAAELDERTLYLQPIAA